MNPGLLQFASESIDLAVEEESGTVELLVTRVGGSDGNVSASYSVLSNSAVDGEDFTAVQGTVVWENGDTEPQIISIDLLDDSIPEDSEQFTVRLERAFPIGNDRQFGEPTEVTVTITDTDVVEEIVAEVPVVDEQPVEVEQPVDEAPDTPPLQDGGNPYILVPIFAQEQSGTVGQNFTALGFEVQDTRNNNAPTPDVVVNWSVEPEGAVIFPDGTVTISDENGIATNRVILLTCLLYTSDAADE